jgi:outer membrane protein OmpA-like peptidoglycan-associated protein
MSIIPPVVPDVPRAKRRLSHWLLGAVVAGLISFLLLSWFFWVRLQRIEVQLQSASQQLEVLASKQESLNTELKQSREQTQSAREQAQAAEERATKSEVARAQAAKEAEQAQVAKILADQQALHAQQQAQNAREELDQIRKAREEELNRMQGALSKVAATRRTADGMVIDLSNDSFKFDFDKATLRPENRELLSRLAGILLVSHGYRLHVYGYTDDIGTYEYNQGLSERRAQVVRDYLAKSGIPAEIMTTKGFGKSSPRVKATSPQARERNRRVEIGIVDTVIKYTEEAR